MENAKNFERTLRSGYNSITSPTNKIFRMDSNIMKANSRKTVNFSNKTELEALIDSINLKKRNSFSPTKNKAPPENKDGKDKILLLEEQLKDCGSKIQNLLDNIEELKTQNQSNLQNSKSLYEEKIANLKYSYERNLENCKKECEEKIKVTTLKLINEKSEALLAERKSNNQKYHKLKEKLEKSFKEERIEIKNKNKKKILNLKALRKSDKAFFKDQIAKLEERNLTLIKEKDVQYYSKISELEKFYENKIQEQLTLNQLKVSKEHEDIMNEKTKEFEDKINTFKNDLNKETKNQMKEITAKLLEETMNERKKYQIEFEDKEKKLKKEYSMEVDELKSKIHDLSIKLSLENELKSAFEEKYENISKTQFYLENEKSNYHTELNLLKENYKSFQEKTQSQNLSNSDEKLKIQLLFTEKINILESELRKSRDELESVNVNYNRSVEELKTRYKKELSNMEEKSSKIINEKEEIIKTINEDNLTKEVTISKYEEMISNFEKVFVY